MEIDKRYDRSGKKILEIIEKKGYKLKKFSKKSLRWVKWIYEELKECEILSKEIEISKNSEIIKKIDEEGSKFMGKDILFFINSKVSIRDTYEFRIGEIKFKLLIYRFDRENIDIKNIISWLIFCTKYKKCSCEINELEIYLYLTPFKKELPEEKGEIIDSCHVNSGYTYRCKIKNEIIIFRKEEWFKLLIHESCHAFGFELSDYSENIIKGKLKKVLNLDIDIDINESYVEFFARIFNVAFKSLNNSRNIDEFKIYFNFFLNYEKLFGIIQINMILKHFLIEGKDFIEKHGKGNELYRENTNVFAYYIIGSIMVNNNELFLNLFYENNENLLNFNNKKIGVFWNLLKKKLIEDLKRIELKDLDFNRNIRMTIIE